MKKTTKLAALTALACGTLVATMVATIAWFSEKVTIETADNVTGSSDGGYFAYGDGSAEDNPDTFRKEGPYGIETPRQLYNLAWLQYLGVFNKVKSGAINQYYFELNADIDMTGWVLPPIGTTANPFVGQFNGQGHTITNLVVSNNYSEMLATKRVPSAVRSTGSISNVNIVGMFGVVGELNDNISATYDTSVNTISNFSLSKAEIRNSASKTLAGIAAGYVNGKLENVGVAESKITTANASNYSDYSQFTNISNYGVVGYCEDEYLGTIRNTVTETYNAVGDAYNYIEPNEGDDAGWGGSIDMRTSYYQIRDAWDSFSATRTFDEENPDEGGTYQYYTTKTIVENPEGEVVSTTYGGKTTYTFTHVNGTGHYYTKTYKDTDDAVTSQYTLAHRSNTSAFMYLYGQNTTTINNALTVNRTYYEELDNCFTIGLTVGGTTHYLSTTNGSSLTDTTNVNSATPWCIDDNNRIFTVINYTNYYYLRYNNGDIGITGNAAQASAWEVNKNDGTIAYVTDSYAYYLYYDETFGWMLNRTGAPHYLFYSNGAYLTYESGYTVGYTTDPSNSSAFWLYNSGGYYHPASNDARKLVYYSDYYPVIAFDQNNRYYTYNNNFLTTTYYGTTYYAYFDGSEWTASTSNPGTAYRVTMTYVNNSNSYSGLSFDATTGPMAQKTDTSTENSSFTTLPTYFPLNQIIDQVETSTIQGYYFYYTIGGTDYYLVYDTTKTNNITFSTNIDDATIWVISNSYISPYGYTNQYLYAPSNTTVGCGDTQRNRYTYGNNRISRTANRRTYYVYFNGTSWVSNTTERNVSRTAKYATQNIYSGIPKDSNTGYVTSGGNDKAGDIRVSQYDMSDSLPNGLNEVYSYNDSGSFRITSTLANNYQRYSDSIAALQKVFNEDSSNIYGLHFVGATVAYGGNQSVYAQKATVNGATYTNYELPSDCIDFNLREKGYINFVAGTYFSGSDNCFFSLHDVFRDSSTNSISEIKEIVEIYSSDVETNSYVYKYSDGTYSVAFKYKNGQKVLVSNENIPYVEGSITNTLETGYSTTPIFKTSWIKKNSLNQYKAYYFEIPMNPGEYCLSSVANTNGAYLMYLDIGANAQKIYRSEIIEYWKIMEELYSYPKGVGIILAAGNSVSDQNSYCVCLKETYSGTLTMEKVKNGDVEEGKYTGTGNADKESLTYKHPNLIVKDENNQTKTATPTSTETTEVKRLTYYDYNMGTGATNKIVITDTIKDGTTTRTLERYTLFDVETQEGTESTTLKVFYITGIDIIDVTNNINIVSFDTAHNTSTILVYNILCPDGSTLTITMKLNVGGEETEGHIEYTPSGYDITITLTNGEGQSTDITANCYVTTVVNNDGTYTYTFTINGKTPVAGGEPIVITVPSA